jgi:hypothetical protein
MTEYILKSNGEERKILFPQGYHDLTYGQLIRLRMEPTNDIGQLLDILTGIPRAIWMQLSITEAAKIQKFLQWVIESPCKWEELKVPKTLHYKGVDYPIPADLGMDTFGQKIVLEAKISAIVSEMLKATGRTNMPDPKKFAEYAQHKSATQMMTLIPYIVAIYMQPRVQGKQFDESEITEIEYEILNCRAVEVYPIGNFFIQSLIVSAQSGAKLLQAQAKKVKAGNYKKKPVSKKSKKRRATS